MPHHRLRRTAIRLAVLLAVAGLGAASAPVLRAGDASAATAKKDNGTFLKLHQSFLERGKAGPIGLLFLGDSITARWNTVPELWQQYYGEYAPANFGIPGDSTQHVIWRIAHGELDGITPRVVVLMIGTNNTGTNSAEEIAQADRKIVGLIRDKIPGVKVLLLAIFPRGPRKGTDGVMDTGAARMEKIKAVNADLAQLDDGKTVRFLDLGPKFLGPDGTIPDDIMKDHLHPTPAGLKIWGDAMKPLLAEMMGSPATK
jgi:lysophospholipase L1-like esterase